MSDNIGPVSRWLSPFGRNWETVIFIQGRPPLDSEFNLFQDIQTTARRELWLQNAPSGFTNWRSLYAPNNGNVTNGFTANQATQPYGTLSTTGPFTGPPYNITSIPVVPGTYQLIQTAPFTVVATDNGSGVISGTSILTGAITGTINYTTGVVSISFALAPSTAYTIAYSYYVADAGNDSLGGDFLYTMTANTVTLANQQVAVVNGFECKLFPNNPLSDSFPIIFPAPPSPAQTRIDLAYLEVWRALVQYPPGAPTDLDSVGNVFQHGGTQFQPTGGFTNFAMPSEIVDPAVGAATTSRVQVQWAIRTRANINLTSYADGLDDPTLFPQGPNISQVSSTAETQSLPLLELVGTGNNSQILFPYTTAHTPVLADPTHVSGVTVTAGSIIGTDNGIGPTGAITGTGITGTIVYATGVVSVTFTPAPLISVPVTVRYTSTSVGPYTFTLDAVPVVPSSFALKSNITTIGTDNGLGAITGGTIASGGTINYTTGAISFTLTTGPAVNPNWNAAWNVSNAFVNQGDNQEQRDAGCWTASNVPGTVDGLVHVVPICAVSRRNTAAWTSATNQNGGSILSSGSSTRPDGLYADQIAEKDIIDLRRSISLSGFNWPELMEKNLSWLFDEKLKTNLQTNPLGGSSIGTSWTQIDAIGTSGSGANLIGSFNGIQAIYSDASQVTNLGLQIPFVGGTEPYRPAVIISVHHIVSGVWSEGDTIQIQVPGTSSALFEDVSSTVTLSYAGTAVSSSLQSSHISIVGLNTNQITITLLPGFNNDIPLANRTIGALSDLPMLISCFFLFQKGSGLSRNSTTYSSPLVLNGSNPANWGQVTTGSPWPVGVNTTFDSTIPTAFIGFNQTNGFYNPSRSVTALAQYKFDNTVPSGPYDTTSESAKTVVLPLAVDTTSAFGNPKVYLKSAGYGVGTEFYAGGSIGGAGGNVLTLGTPLTGWTNSSPVEVLVGFVSMEPIRSSTSHVTFYYESPAFQTLALPISGMDMTQVHLGDFVYTAIGGAGSDAPSFPYIRPVNQIPITAVINGSSVDEAGLQAFGYITVDDFSSISQFMKLAAFIPLASIPEWRFRTVNVDYDGSVFPSPGKSAFSDVTIIPFSDLYNGNPIAYQPAVFSQLLYSSVMHTTVYPTLAVLRTDVLTIGHRGTVFMVLWSRTNNDQQNAVIFTTTPDTSSNASIFRLKGNPTMTNRGNQHA